MNNFGLAEEKNEGDTVGAVFEQVFYYCPIIHNSMVEEKLKEGLFFVIYSDGQPFTMVKRGEIHFVMHKDKNYANSKYKLSVFTKIKNYLKRILND